MEKEEKKNTMLYLLAHDLALQADLNLRTERRKTKRTGGIIIVLPD
jgi:hypothetical protein